MAYIEFKNINKYFEYDFFFNKTYVFWNKKCLIFWKVTINKDIVEYSLHINFWPLILLGELLENLFNKVYSQSNNFYTAKYLEEDKSSTTKFPNQIVWSLTKTLGEETDSWTNIHLNNALDLDGDLGKVTSLKRINNDTKRDHYMDAEEAMNYGIVDKILK